MDTTTTTKANGEAIARVDAPAVAMPGSPVISSRLLGWRGLIAQRFMHAPGEHRFPVFPRDTISLYLGQSMRSVRWSAEGFHEGSTVRGDVTVKASGQPAGWRIEEAADLLCICFDPTFLSDVAEENELDPDTVELRPILDQRDEAVEHISLAMLVEIEAGGVGGKVYGDALAIALATHLLRNHATFPQLVPDYGRGLPKSAIRRVTDYVNDNLCSDLALSGMAGVASLSPYHFSRQFKRSTGLSPHQYVIERRLERARDLLSQTELPVGDVASAVGFTHQSHLARHFRRRFGVAPSSLRK